MEPIIIIKLKKEETDLVSFLRQESILNENEIIQDETGFYLKIKQSFDGSFPIPGGVRFRLEDMFIEAGEYGGKWAKQGCSIIVCDPNGNALKPYCLIENPICNQEHALFREKTLITIEAIKFNNKIKILEHSIFYPEGSGSARIDSKNILLKSKLSIQWKCSLCQATLDEQTSHLNDKLNPCNGPFELLKILNFPELLYKFFPAIQAALKKANDCDSKTAVYFSK